jgi:predicted nucleic acid-binding protein
MSITKKERASMAFSAFLDANILLDFLLKREAYESSRQLISLAVNGGCKAYISSSIIHIAGYWLTKAYGSEKAKELLLTLLSDVEVIDLSHEISINALHSRIVDIEDALQYYTALHHKLDCFISRNKALQKASIPVLPVFTPEDFLKDLPQAAPDH